MKTRKVLSIILLVTLISCTGHRVLLDVPQFDDQFPEIETGFYTVYKINDGTITEKKGTEFLGKLVYLYKDDTFVDGHYFSGVKGSFLPNNFIKTGFANSQPFYYWVNAEDEEISGKITFTEITYKKIRAVFITDTKNQEEVELRFYKRNIWNDKVKTIPIAHRGLSYQPPSNYDGIFPANTWPGFEAALRSGYGGFELDVRITKDNQFVISHDEDLNVSTTVRGEVKEKNLSEFENILVVRSAAIPENKSTAKQAYIAAPIISLDRVVKHFIDDPRLKTIVVDIKPDTDERIVTAAKKVFEGITIEQQKKILFLTREESVAKLLKELYPYSDIGLEGTTGTEPVDELEKYFPEAVNLPRQSHNTISFGSNWILAFQSIETSIEMINLVMNNAKKYNYKVCMWTFAKEWRLNFLRENKIYPDFILSDVPYYQYALQQMRFVNEENINIDGKTVPTKEFRNPIYKRKFNQYVRDFWLHSRTLIELTYGLGKPSQNYFQNSFASVGNWELKVGRSELNKFNTTNVELSEAYFFLSSMNSKSAINKTEVNQVTTKALRFGIGYTDGFGYEASFATIIPYVSQSFTWTKLQEYSDFLKYDESAVSMNDSNILNRYWKSYRFGDRALYGIKADILSSVQLNLNYETAVIYPRHLFWNWAGSYILSQVGYSALGYSLDKFVDNNNIIGPIINSLVRAGYLYGYYLLRKENMNWPFSTEAPLRYETFNLGISFVL